MIETTANLLLAKSSHVVNSNYRVLSNIVLLVDESAMWKVGGLPQIERILLMLNDYAARQRQSEPLRVKMYDFGGADRRMMLPDRQLPYVTFVERFESDQPVMMISTRLIVDDDAFNDETLPAVVLNWNESTIEKLIERFRSVERAACSQTESQDRHWKCLNDANEISACEKWLLRRTQKSQDGFIARFINRPASRFVSRYLLRLPLNPNQLTLLLTAIPVAGAIFNIRGTYLGFAIGAILFQLHSMLDGCDGEIARVKYLQSERGRKLDEICDRFSSLLYALSLGIGLSHQPPVSDLLRWIYPLEGIVAALLIGVAETWLTKDPMEEHLEIEPGGDFYRSYVQRKRASFNEGDHAKLWVIKNSRILFLGENFAAFFSQLTKRDVFNFGFMVLALCGRPSWILHIFAISAGMIGLAALKNLLSPVVSANQARVP